jgi:hypothetical protein
MATESIANLWSMLKTTYTLNDRDIQYAYGEGVYAKVDRWYESADSTPPSSIIVTNKRLMTEEYLQFVIRKKIFVAIFTLRKKSVNYTQKPDFLSECRLFDAANWSNYFTVSGSATMPVISTPSTSSVSSSASLPAVTTTTTADDEPLSTSKLGFNVVTAVDEDGGSDDDEDDDDSGSSSSSDDETIKMFGYVSKSLMTNKGKKFGAKGIRRQHWAQKAYCHFFHRFLHNIRSLRYVEKFCFYDEDRKIW